ncbi:hypothetical protein C8A01DRAFT_19669 [Parachaetomium inaequale]|uniref:Uncharacterized protein n=1 Tax=Parachaetomium inaequale TaxID=2588326 RepID=A0AAN6P7V0_9PEZI|nr:hypothetical protein C8A01DRAFT_19669 [Parachaetomium inaequale]
MYAPRPTPISWPPFPRWQLISCSTTAPSSWPPTCPIPQLRLFFLRRNSSGISLYYVLFNLILSPELSTFAFLFVVNLGDVNSDVSVHGSSHTGDWIHLAQLAAVCVL